MCDLYQFSSCLKYRSYLGLNRLFKILLPLLHVSTGGGHFRIEYDQIDRFKIGCGIRQKKLRVSNSEVGKTTCGTREPMPGV